jgi:hypothetical protein
MKRTFCVCLFLCVTTTFLLSQSNPVPPGSTTKADPKAQIRILDSYGKLPLAFEANHGQTDARVKFLSRTGGYTLFLTGDEAVLTLNGKKPRADKAKIMGASHKLSSSVASAPKPGGVLRMKLRNANPAAKVTGTDELGGTSNYFIGNDPAKWRTNVPTYAKVKYEGIYSGIDLVYYGNQRQLEYDFIVAPGANPRRIAFDVRGAMRIRKNANGELIFKVGDDEIRWRKPVVYQETDGAKQEIPAHYSIKDKNHVGFEVAKYDASRPLYIDPLIYSTYLGGSNNDAAYGIAVDSSGDAYVTGGTSSSDFPVTTGAFQTMCGNPCVNGFVTKLNSTGSALVYSTYQGYGANGIAVDSLGNAYVTGGSVAELNSTGSALVYSFGLDSAGNGIAVDSSGSAYVTGTTGSTNFPTTPGAFQTACPGFCSSSAFVIKVNPTGSAPVYSTYLYVSRDSLWDVGSGIAVDGVGNAYITGSTLLCRKGVTSRGTCWAPAGPAIQSTFVAELNSTGSALNYLTFLGDNGSQYGSGIAVDSAGNAYITGLTGESLPTTPGAFQTSCGSRNNCQNAFLAKINPSGVLVYGTYLGGSDANNGMGSIGHGVAVDGAGTVYVTGQAYSTNFPTTPDAFQTTCGSCYFINGEGSFGNSFVTKIEPVPATTTTLKPSPNPSTYGQAVTFAAVVSSRAGTPPDGELVSFMEGTAVLGTGTLSSGSASFTTSTLPVGKNSVTAVYGGDSNFAGSTSKAVKQVVKK